MNTVSVVSVASAVSVASVVTGALVVATVATGWLALRAPRPAH